MTNYDMQHGAPEDEADPGLAGFDEPLQHLRRALDNDDLQVFCQPIRALQGAQDRYPMAEVLVRMREEESALLPPGDFLPVFEHYRMLTDLDCWVARKTLEWIAQARPRSIRSYTINVSSQSLDDAKLEKCISAALVDCGVRPELLCMEIDEVDTLLKADATERFVRSMRSVGTPSRFSCSLETSSFEASSLIRKVRASIEPWTERRDCPRLRRHSVRSLPASSTRASHSRFLFELSSPFGAATR